MVVVAVVVVSVVWSAVAERSGDTAFGETGCLRKRRGAPLPAAVQDAPFFSESICGFPVFASNRENNSHGVHRFFRSLFASGTKPMAAQEHKPPAQFFRNVFRFIKGWFG
jgi:hypothetical protein